MIKQKPSNMQFIAVKQVGVLGRVIIPSEVRKALNMQAGSMVRVYVDGRKIILQAVDSGKGCVLCGGPEANVVVSGRKLCMSCVIEVSRARKFYRRAD